MPVPRAAVHGPQVAWDGNKAVHQQRLIVHIVPAVELGGDEGLTQYFVQADRSQRTV